MNQIEIFRRASTLSKHRSKLEDVVIEKLERLGVSYVYEPAPLLFFIPERKALYIPDLILSNGILVEIKGLFKASDRKKTLLVKELYPDLDLRFVFKNSKTKISPKSKVTYGQWANDHGFLYADKEIPSTWLEEEVNHKSIETFFKAIADTQKGLENKQRLEEFYKNHAP